MEIHRELNNIWTIGAKEFMDNIKSRRFILIGTLYLVIALLILSVTVLQYRGNAEAYKPAMLFGLMDFLNIILVLLAAIVTADTLSLEKMNRTIYQLLSKPVERSSVIIGKFFGCLGIVSFLFIATSAVAYLLSAVIIGVVPTAGDMIVSLEVLAFMVILFTAYVGIGLFISTITRNPMISIVGSILVWVALFVSNTFGGALGLSASPEAYMAYIMGSDPFPYYPWYSRILVFLDPISHDIVNALINGIIQTPGNVIPTVDGLSLWANAAYILLISGIILLATIAIFNRQDI
jgi:ABC-2 type transport system permease protein